MSINIDKYAEIRRGHNKGLSQREISRQTGISRNTIKKYCSGAAVPWERKKPERKSPILTEEVVDFITQCLDEDDRENIKKQKYTAQRIYDRLVSEKGFTGSYSSIRAKVRELRQTRGKAFIPLSFEPGEAMQVDWGEATIYLNEEKKKIYLFCARLCYSCKPFVLAYTHANEESFLDAFVQVFTNINGVPARVIFDNAKVAVKMGYGAKAEKQEGYSKLCSHYGFDAIFCNRASGHEKGLVEGLVGWSRRNILVPIPHVNSLEELNEQLYTRCSQYEDKHIQGKPDTVGAMFQKEKEALLPLAPYPFETGKSINARVSALCTVRYQTNEYSVPSEYVGCQVGIKAYPEKVEIYYNGKKIAEHKRLFGKNEKSCRLIDYLSLLEERGRAVLNSVPVKQNLSPQTYEELKANIKNPEKVKEILRREASLPLEIDKKSTPKESQVQLLPKDDPVKIKKVQIYAYDSLMAWGEEKNK